MKLENLPMEKIVIGLVLLGVFAAVFFVAQVLPKGTDTTLDGVHILASGDAKAQLQGLLSKTPVLIQMNLINANDSRNTALTIVTAEIASSLIAYNTTNYVYGAVEGNASVNCVPQTNFCTGAVIFVQLGPFDGMRINDTAVVVEGTAEFFHDFAKLKVIKGVFGLAASGS
ncbi:hypothetical protein HY994_04350 [Candidatus Micrarchaeota archaeon]|nr:hypothetical protein [Candidatus Micrarchaeota archaeon]